MDIEAIVKKHLDANWYGEDSTGYDDVAEAMRDALTELAAGYEKHRKNTAHQINECINENVSLRQKIRQLEAERASPELLAFLRGAAPLEGVWFGNKHPTKHAPYWWRSYLGANVLPSAPAKEGE